MRGVTALSTAFLMIVSSMAGCIEGLEDIAEAIGCTDENADNFDPDATSGTEDLCYFLENEARFMAAMGDAMAADPSTYLLDSDSGVSGVHYGMEMSGVDSDSGMSMSVEVLSVIMVDLESQSMYNRSMISYMDMVSVDTEMVWSGTDVMITTSIGGPMASEVGDSGTTSSISRDMVPDLEEVVRAASFGMMGMMGMEDLLMSGGLPGGDQGDDGDDHRDDGDHDVSWDSYPYGYCEWEGYSDATDAGEDSRWWCKISQDDEEWENWWYYCEYHESDHEGDVWHCTDDFGQSEDFEYSADGDEASREFGDEDCNSDVEICEDGDDREDDGESDFGWFDRNQDDFVEMGEVETAVYEEPSISSEMADCIIDNVSPVFSDADENDDQKLDENEFSEFDNYLENNFDIDEACGDSEASMDDMMPEGASVSITHDEETGIQTMVMQTVDDNGDMAMTIRLHGDGSFHSYEMGMDDGESVMTMAFSYLTSEMVSIPEIDYTLDRTATPISVHVEPMMVCDDGELVPAWSVMDGWEDCGDGSDESFGDSDEEDGDGEADIDDMMEWGDGDWDGILSFEEFFTAMTDMSDLHLTSADLLDLLESTVADDSGESEAGIDISFYWDREGDLWGTYNYDYTVEQDYTHIDFNHVGGVVMYSATSTVTSLYDPLPSGISEGDWVEFSVVFSESDIEPYFEASGENGMFGDSCYNMGDAIDCSSGATMGMSFPEGVSYEIEYESGFSDSGMIYEIEIIDGGIWCDYSDDREPMCHSGNNDDVQFVDMYGGITWEMSGDSDWIEHSVSDTMEAVQEFWMCDSYNGAGDGFGALEGEGELGCLLEGIPEILNQHIDLESDDEDDDEICIWEDEDGVVHYDCEDSWEDYDFPMVMHAHVVDQVANAPIADFELRMLDCDEGDMDSEDDMEDDSDPIWDECTVVMAFPLSGGEIDGVLVDYVDSDGDGMVSSGDISIVSGPVSEYEIQPYDTWAEEYSADSALIGQELPGFGAFLGVIGLLGAALAGRERDA